MAILPVSFGETAKGYVSLTREKGLSSFLTRRYAVLGLVVVALLTLVFRMYHREVIYDVPMQFAAIPAKVLAPLEPEYSDPALKEDARWPGRTLPPLYPEWHRRDLLLPQHHWHDATIKSQPKFFHIPGHTRNSGWGNYFEELIMNAHLAYRMNRALVFYNHTWRIDGTVYTDYNGKPIPSQIPLSAILRGPIVGDPFPESAPSPPAVIEEYFEWACQDRKMMLNRHRVHNNFRNGGHMLHDVVNGWVKHMSYIDEQCVEVEAEEGVIFHFTMFGEPEGLHGIWEEFKRSPIMTHFLWSPLVELAFDNNRMLISPPDAAEPPLAASPHLTNRERYTELPGLLVMHVRRGDFDWHCQALAGGAAEYATFNALPGLERWRPWPKDPQTGEVPEEGKQEFLRRCWPDVARIVERANDVRVAEAERGQTRIDRVYIMTNGAPDWLDELKRAFWATGHWAHVTTSRDLLLTPEQKYVAQTIDQLIGQRAQVFMGNGWSTLSGGIVIFRHANGFRPESTTFF